MAKVDTGSPKTCGAVVVTGSGSGIGAAIATRMATDGTIVALLDRADMKETCRAVEKRGAQAVPVITDVSDEVSVRRAVETVLEHTPTVSTLVNNAGVSRLGPSESVSLSDWRASMDVIALGTFLCSREFFPHFHPNGASIVNITSINGLVAFPLRLAYSAAKAAVISMTEVLAVEWASRNIRVNAVAPGMTGTAMFQSAVANGFIDLDAYLERTPLARIATPAEIAGAVVYLTSNDAQFITGHTLVVDGGWTTFGSAPGR